MKQSQAAPVTNEIWSSSRSFTPLRKLRGSSQGILVREEPSGRIWVLKPDNGGHVLANEIIGTFVYSAFGGLVPEQRIVSIPSAYLANSEVWPTWAGKPTQSPGGECLLVRYLPDELQKVVFEIIPPSYGAVVNDVDIFLGAYLLDICLGNADVRQAIFVPNKSALDVVFIDHGHLFGGPKSEHFRPVRRVWPKLSFAHLALRASDQEGALNRWINLLEEQLVDVTQRACDAVPKYWARRDTSEILEYVGSRLNYLKHYYPLEIERLRMREQRFCQPNASGGVHAMGNVWLGL